MTQHKTPAEKANDARLKREERISLQIVRDALKAGYTVSVHDSEEWALKCSRSLPAIKAAMFTTDDDRLRFRTQGGDIVGTVWLVYGNDCDVICDYSDNVATGAVVKGAEALAERLNAEAFG